MLGLLETMLGGVAAGVGFALGVGATAAGAKRMRPLVKQAVKGGMEAVDRMKEMTAEMGETLQDLYAEAKAEREVEAREAVANQQASGESQQAG